ncbi:General secretion pathway protein G [hydrothermal vent metagenome]|uniref:Type II secretion system core protein G n=1 Tax=hydrothermal vent metagenome TaxID=652676 RepID=A0A3B1AYC3_9ZZZZ
MKIQNLNKTVNQQSGFTLIEVMVVVVILAILAAAIVPNIMNKPDAARITAAKGDIRTLENAASMYKLDNYNYPSTDQGLESLVIKPAGAPEPKHYNKGGYVKKIKKDPWSNPYQYLSPGVHGDIDIYSLGPDQQPSDDDIGNWNIE